MKRKGRRTKTRKMMIRKIRLLLVVVSFAELD